MKAILKADDSAGSFVVRDVPVPEISDTEVLIQIKATGLCYSDMSILNNTYKGRKPVPLPLIMGHEASGIVAKLGSGVTSFQVGQRVCFEAMNGCGVCHACRTGNKNMCKDWDHIGITYDGTFGEYMRIPAELVHPLPDSVDFVSAAILEPLSLVVRSIEHVQPRIGETAAVIGPGSVGLLHVEALKAAGASKIIVIGLDADKLRFEIAREVGATHVVNASVEDPVQAVRKITGGDGVDILIETASSPKVWDYMLDLLASKGRLSCFGLYPEAKFQPLTVIRNGISIYGDVAFVQRHFIRAIQWLEAGKINVAPLITKRFTFDQAAEAFEAFRAKETVKCMFEL